VKSAWHHVSAARKSGRIGNPMPFISPDLAAVVSDGLPDSSSRDLDATTISPIARHSILAPALTVLYLFRRGPCSNLVADFVTDGSGFLFW